MRKEEGQAVLEIALVLPILLFMICAIADFGRILYASSHLNMVTQEAVRLAGLGQSDSQVVQYVSQESTLEDKTAVKVSITPDDTVRKSGDYVTVKVTYQIKYITPFMNKILPSPLNVNIQSTIRVE